MLLPFSTQQTHQSLPMECMGSGTQKYGDLAEFLRRFPMKFLAAFRDRSTGFVIPRKFWMTQNREERWKKRKKRDKRPHWRDLLILLIDDPSGVLNDKKQFTPYSQRSMIWAGLFSKIQVYIVLFLFPSGESWACVKKKNSRMIAKKIDDKKIFFWNRIFHLTWYVWEGIHVNSGGFTSPRHKFLPNPQYTPINYFMKTSTRNKLAK